jgi:hypothetical protein
MDTWVSQINSRARILIDQIVASRLAATESKLELNWLEKQYQDLLEQLYADEYAAAHLRDSSDLVVRAEGPGASPDGPSLRSFAWLSDHMRDQLGKLRKAVLPLTEADAKTMRNLGWVFTGYAPGSIMMGFALRGVGATSGGAEQAAFEMLRNAAQSVAAIPRHIGESELSEGLAEEITDPALRDAAIVAAWNLSPTAKSGISTVEVSSKTGEHGSLSLHERSVLKQSVVSPLFRKTESGSFEGELRAADLDKRRLVLRDVRDVGTIRCAINPELADQAKAYFGKKVRVFGKYEADRNGTPRMMRVERIVEAAE